MTATCDLPVILFVFAGRQPNLELQLPFVRRILEDHPNVEYHVWNFARNDADRAYIKTIEGERITVWNGSNRNGFASPIPTAVKGAKQFGAGEHNAAYRHYSQPEFKDHLFVKVDDDIVFLETARFGIFIEAINAHRDASMVANIVNNGACTPVNPGIWQRYEKLEIPLLDIHMSNAYTNMVHTYMHQHHDELLNQPIELVPTEDWLSINAVGYDWNFLRHVLKTIGKPHPAHLAGRPMEGWGRCFGDEGVFQTLPRIIVKGFTAAHLTYGPQNPTPRQFTRWRDGYRALGEQYLNSEASRQLCSDPLPALSEISCGYVGVRGAEAAKILLVPEAQQAAARWGANNWRTRWLERNGLAVADSPHWGNDINDPTVGRYIP